MTPLIAFISLTAPLMMWGLALLALPVAAHLLNRRARRRLVFPTIRLLQDSAATQSHLFRLRRLILLLLRCLAVAIIVWAFAQPVWTGATASAGGGTQGGTVVLVDTSLSTAYRPGGVAVAASIRAAAQRALDGLRGGADSADIVLAGAQPTAIFGRLIPNLPALREELDRIAPSHGRADLAGAIGLAGRLLAVHDGPRRLVVVTDLQQSNWLDVAEAETLADLLPAGTRITIAEPEVADGGNVALSSPRAYPPRPLVGQTAQVLTRATNHAADPVSIEVALTMDGRAAGVRRIGLRPAEQRDIAFDLVLADETEHEIEFTIDADDLAGDDASYLVVRAVRRLPVIVIGDDDPQEPGSSAYFIERALAPRGDPTDQYEVRRIPSRAIDTDALSGAAAVVIGDVALLREAAVASLLEYLDAGGGVAYLLGDGPVAENLARLDGADDDGGVLPWAPGPVRHHVLDATAARIMTGSWRARMLQAFDERSQLALARVRLERIWSVRDVRPGARVLLRFGDGTPALASRRLGRGRIVLANFSPSLRCGDLGKYGTFVALMHALVRDLQSETDVRPAALVGAPCRLAAADGGASSASTVVDPGGEPVPSLAGTESDGAEAVIIPHPARPGFYRLRRGGTTTGRVAVNVDPRESDLRRLDGAALARRLGDAGEAVEVAGARSPAALAPPRGRPLWSWLVVAALAVLGLELAVLSVWSR